MIAEYRLILTGLVTFEMFSKNFNISTLNCHGLKRCLPYVMDLLESNDVVFVNEHWLQNKVPMSELHGRPHGGVAFLCNKINGISYRIMACDSDRIEGLQI